MKATGYSRVSKEMIMSQIERELEGRAIFFVTEYGTVPAASLDKLRGKLRGSKARYFVVKKTLGRRVLEKIQLKSVAESMQGACGLALGGEDPVASSKILLDFAKENESFKVHSAYLDGKILAAADIKVLAALPSREVLLGRVVGGINAPISRFVNVLASTVRGIVTVLDAIAKKKGGSA